MILKDLLLFKGKKRVARPIGFEVEMEGKRLPRKLTNWRVTTDGSLKGEEAREYVLTKPMTYLEFCNALTELKTALKESNSRVDISVRAGVHTHINVQDLTPLELFNYITLCILMEELLAEFCGKNRIGNLFCLRATDANYLIKVIKDVAETGNFNLFHTDDIRYSFMNLKAVVEHGSVEFRGMRSTTDFDVLKQWVQILQKLKKSSKDFKRPDEIIMRFSGSTAQEFLKEILGERAKLLQFHDADKLLFNGMRSAQDIAYGTEWERLATLGANNPFSKVNKAGLFPDTQPKAIKYKKRKKRKGPELFGGVGGIEVMPLPGGGGAATVEWTTAAAPPEEEIDIDEDF